MFFFLLTVYNKVLILSLDIFFNFTQCFKIIRLYQRKPLTPADTFVINFPPHSESWYLTTLSPPSTLHWSLRNSFMVQLCPVGGQEAVKTTVSWVKPLRSSSRTLRQEDARYQCSLKLVFTTRGKTNCPVSYVLLSCRRMKTAVDIIVSPAETPV